MFDPVVATRAHGWSYDPANFSFGGFDDMVRHVERLLSARHHIAGDAFTAADTQFGAGIHYALDVLKVLPERPVFRAYVQRLGDRPAFQSFMAKDLELARAAGMAG